MISLTSGSSMTARTEATSSRPSSPPPASPPGSPPAVHRSSKASSLLGPLRKLVSGNRTRVSESGFDLDMAYITPRIIAMAFPAVGMEAAIRNPRTQVLAFLKRYHENRYLVFNLCAESRHQYDPLVFSHRTASAGAVGIPIRDHSVPTLYQIADFCHQAQSWLHQHDDNVVVVHCLGGKGRSGLMVSCLLIALKESNNAAEAIELFNSMRSKTGDSGGLTIPSQIRFVKLFEELFVLSKLSVPLSITSLSVAKYRWTLLGVELGPSLAILQSIKVRSRSAESATEIELPLLLQQRLKSQSLMAAFGQRTKSGDEIDTTTRVELKEGVFESTEDAHFSIKLKKGLLVQSVKFWLCAQMSQTMVNHRCTSEGHSVTFFNSGDLDAPSNADRSLAVSAKEDSPNERFYVKVSLKFSKLDN